MDNNEIFIKRLLYVLLGCVIYFGFAAVLYSLMPNQASLNSYFISLIVILLWRNSEFKI